MSTYEVCIYWSQSGAPALIFKANGQSNSGYSFVLDIYQGGHNIDAGSFAGETSWQGNFQATCSPIGYTRKSVSFGSIMGILDDAAEGTGLTAKKWVSDSLNGLSRARIITASQASMGQQDLTM
ncbi:hypothetical protein LMH87_009335 [Akanthomyces muscarius]|uniref:Uncharacterized protein n=1 Tax=Akanthomyces muscarius TaxID=2231603 RepID=A0A9W8ULS9_AKAMU|nr:hypothetical protein LMH87_009335 [Akanthomyces muscarius]KAJ4152815.1 hypothetical protein LMH87_009335 [Akanthomyces muscarius]